MRIGYVIHILNTSIHSRLSSVLTPLVDNTVKPPMVQKTRVRWEKSVLDTFPLTKYSTESNVYKYGVIRSWKLGPIC